MRNRASTLALACSLASLFAPRAYAADALTIETVEHGAWSSSIAALQTDPRAEGSTLHVVVRDGNGRALPCGSYTLAFDDAGVKAFELGPCAAAAQATSIVLAHRTALFEHGAPDGAGPSTPREVLVVASRVETAGASGGAKVEAKSAVACSAEVSPYMPDLEHGTRVPLHPGRYVLKTRQPDVRVTHDDTHWTLARDAASADAIDYELHDAKTATVVLRERVMLSCGGPPRGASVAAVVRLDAAPPLSRASLADAPGEAASAEEKPWEGHAWTVSARSGVAVLKAGGLVFQNSSGYAEAASLGLRDAAGVSSGLHFAFERPWLYTSIGLDFAYAGVADRSLYAFSGATTVAPSMHVGLLSAYAGPQVALSSYQVTAAHGTRWEWGSKPDIGLGAAAGARLHFPDGASTWVLGVEASTPVAGREPTLFLVSLGWGGGR